MGDPKRMSVLITGANSGLGFEAAAQFAGDGYDRVILACRSMEKAAAARDALIDRCGREIFELLVLDTAEPASAREAAAELRRRGGTIDVLLLNAGMGAADFQTNSQGIDVVYASTLVGHHVLTLALLAQGQLSDAARIIIAGSEAARSDLKGMGMVVDDFRQTAARDHGGDLAAAMVAASIGQGTGRYNPNTAYANAKALVAWWAASLSRRLPHGMGVYAVSPGAAMSTSFGRNMPFFMRRIMVPMMRIIGPVMGISGSVAAGARRYVEAARFGEEGSGGFYASPPGKMIGPLQPQETPHLLDEALQEAGWVAIVALTGSPRLDLRPSVMVRAVTQGA